MKRKIAFIVQRYGNEVNGGAELHCRYLAEKLSVENEIDILTTCAVDYTTWENYYDEGESYVNDIRVKRFPTKSPRNKRLARRLKKYIEPRTNQLIKFRLTHFFLSFMSKHRNNDKWFEAQGPFCPDLIRYIEEEHHRYDILIFMTYLYYPTAVGLRIAPEKSLLIPTAHDEKPIYFSCFNQVFQLPSYIMFNTESEQNFVHKLFKNKKIAHDIAGVGIDEPSKEIRSGFKEENNIEGDFLLYTGRVDPNKGVNELFKLFFQHKKHYQSNTKLVIIGKTAIPIPNHPDIIYLGFVSDEIKVQAMKEALLLVLPSKYESLSMVVLESLSLNTPVLVNGACEVLVDHCKKSGAGFFYKNKTDFNNAIEFAKRNKEKMNEMGKLGKEYVDKNYQWHVILEKFTKAFDIIDKSNPVK